MTYEELLKQINAAGQTGQWSRWDLETAKNNPAFGAGILSYKRDYAAAKDAAGKRAANAGAEVLRRQYGSYLGGSDGSRYYGLGGPAGYQSTYQGALDEALGKLGETRDLYRDQMADTIGRMNSYGDFSYDPAPEYQNQYQRELDALLQKVQDYGPFSWSKEKDPSYAAYAKQYRREGDRATANAMAQAAAATGGQISTAAMTAASQAGDYYAGKLSDKIPELYENAYQRYLSEYSRLTDQLGQVRTAEQSDYAKYLDQLSQYNADRAQSYDQWLQGYNMLGGNLSAMQGQRAAELNAMGEQLGAVQDADKTAYSRYLDQINYNAQQDALAREQAAQQQNLYQQQVDAILAAGGSPSADLVGSSGYASEYVNAMENYYRQKTASSGGARSSSGGGGGSVGAGSSSGSIYQQLYDAGVRSQGDAYAMLTAMGYNNTQAKTLAGYFAEMLDDEAGGLTGDASGGNLTVDKQSVLALGYGPIDDAELDRLVRSGEVEEYQEGNKIKFRKKEEASSGAAWGAGFGR